MKDPKQQDKGVSQINSKFVIDKNQSNKSLSPKDINDHCDHGPQPGKLIFKLQYLLILKQSNVVSGLEDDEQYLDHGDISFIRVYDHHHINETVKPMHTLQLEWELILVPH